VVASVPPIHSLVAAIMAGVGEPVLLIPGTASPHTFSLRPSDARTLAAADIVVWVGPVLETSLARPLASLSGAAHLVTLAEAPGIALLEVREGGAWGEHDDHEAGEGAHGDGAPGHAEARHQDERAHSDADHAHATHEDRDGHAHDDDEIDAHIWLSTGNAQAIVAAVAAELIEHDPARAATYAANRDAELRRLDMLAERLRARLSPVTSRPFVVTHDGYQYFERQFGLNAVGAITVSPEVRPGVRRMAELRAHVQELGARCIFAEPQFGGALVRTLAEGTGARIGLLDPIGAALPPGRDLYPRLMEDLADAFTGCLAADG
jgi:zinc transport system substrate-binding protein